MIQRMDNQGQPLNSTSNAMAMTSTTLMKSSNRSNLYSNQNFENHLVNAASRLSNTNMIVAGIHPYNQCGT